jgi:hypothetical protein
MSDSLAGLGAYEGLVTQFATLEAAGNRFNDNVAGRPVQCVTIDFGEFDDSSSGQMGDICVDDELQILMLVRVDGVPTIEVTELRPLGPEDLDRPAAG